MAHGTSTQPARRADGQVPPDLEVGEYLPHGLWNKPGRVPTVRLEFPRQKARFGAVRQNGTQGSMRDTA